MITLNKFLFLLKSIVIFVLVCASIPIIAFYNTTETKSFYVLILLTTLWTTEVIPMPITSMLPVIILPMFDIMSTTEVCSYYFNEIGMLLFGGWILGASFDESGLSKRIATNVLRFAGTSPFKLLMAYSMTTALMTMWFSNTVVTSMMITIAKAQFREYEKNASMDSTKGDISVISNSNVELIKEKLATEGSTETPKNLKHLFKATLLAVVYGANIGGASTLIGTIANIILVQEVRRMFPQENMLTFPSFLVYGVVSMILDVTIGVIVLWWYFVKLKCRHTPLSLKSDGKALKTGPISYKELCVGLISLLVVFLFIFKSSSFVRGWEESLQNEVMITEATPLVMAVFFLFILPADPKKLAGERLFHWKDLEKHLSFGIILVIGGILSLSGLLDRTGITFFMRDLFLSAHHFDPHVLLLVFCFVCTFVTEIISSLLVVLIFLPIIGTMAVAVHVNPLYFMVPTAIVVSYAFMLPVATIPNTMAAQEGSISIFEMAIPGFFMNIFCLLIQYGLAHSLGNILFSFNEIPSWLELYYNNSTNSPL